MAQPTKNATPSKPTAPTPPSKGAPTPPASSGMSAAQAKKEGAEPKRPRVRWVSTKDRTFWVRSYKDVTDKHGAPKDPWGETMVPAQAGGGGEALKAARAEREAKLAAMTEEQRVAFLKTEREAKKANRAAKKQAEYDALVAKIRAEMAAGKL